ncbi:hypothetical protein C8035_v004743 [Colletotrichum spinosum]|uniref:Uncharacterized protein n=1 Tax=Colletotrichum spinosum TaxID=1347390 RepID=A0A4R8QHX9_9PEZI|nr:hypothetical protein C8035_v004743 [Colletotrichum spinosum]
MDDSKNFRRALYGVSRHPLNDEHRPEEPDIPENSKFSSEILRSLDNYKPISSEDDTSKILGAFLSELLGDGQKNVLRDIHTFKNDAGLRNFANTSEARRYDGIYQLALLIPDPGWSRYYCRSDDDN